MSNPDVETARALAEGSKIMGPDGVVRDRQAEADLNKIAAQIFGQPGGDRLLAWLKSITVNRTFGPAVTDDQLRHQAGQSYIVALIERRITDGRSGKPVPAAAKPAAGGKRKSAARAP